MKSIGFKRRRKALTNYRHRLALVKGSMDRIAVRKTNKRIIAQVIRYEEKGDKVLMQLDSSALSSYEWHPRSNRASAYLTGLMLARKVLKDAKAKDAEYILDIGLSSPVRNSIPFMFARGCVDGGLKLRSGIETDDKVFDIASEYAKKLKEEDEAKYNKQFSKYIKDGVQPTALNELFAKAKERILKE